MLQKSFLRAKLAWAGPTWGQHGPTWAQVRFKMYPGGAKMVGTWGSKKQLVTRLLPRRFWINFDEFWKPFWKIYGLILVDFLLIFGACHIIWKPFQETNLEPILIHFVNYLGGFFDQIWFQLVATYTLHRTHGSPPEHRIRWTYVLSIPF